MQTVALTSTASPKESCSRLSPFRLCSRVSAGFLHLQVGSVKQVFLFCFVFCIVFSCCFAPGQVNLYVGPSVISLPIGICSTGVEVPVVIRSPFLLIRSPCLLLFSLWSLYPLLCRSISVSLSSSGTVVLNVGRFGESIGGQGLVTLPCWTPLSMDL